MKFETGLVEAWKSFAPFMKLPFPEKEQTGHLAAPGAPAAPRAVRREQGLFRAPLPASRSARGTGSINAGREITPVLAEQPGQRGQLPSLRICLRFARRGQQHPATLKFPSGICG